MGQVSCCKSVHTNKDPDGLGKKRLLHIDFLRVLAIALVIFNHVEGATQYSLEESRILQCLYLSMTLLCTVAVPLFYMMSGALLLGREESLKRVFFNRVVKYGLILLLISLLYFLSDAAAGRVILSLREFVYFVCTTGVRVPLWYLYSYLAIMMMLPLLRRMAQGMNNREFIYLALFAFFFRDLIPLIETLVDCPQINVDLRGELFVSDRILYFLMGYFFENRIQDAYKNRKLLIVGILLSILSIASAVCIILYQGSETGEYTKYFQKWFMAIPIYTIYFSAKYYYSQCQYPWWRVKWLTGLGGTVFGIYLLEGFLREATANVYMWLKPAIGVMPASIIWVLCSVLLGYFVVYVFQRATGLIGKAISKR